MFFESDKALKETTFIQTMESTGPLCSNTQLNILLLLIYLRYTAVPFPPPKLLLKVFVFNIDSKCIYRV